MKSGVIFVVVLMVCGMVMGDESYQEQDQPQPTQESSECRNFHRVQTHVDISLVWKLKKTLNIDCLKCESY